MQKITKKVGEKTSHQEEIHNQSPVEHLAAQVPAMVLEVRSLNLQTRILGILHATQKLHNRTTKKICFPNPKLTQANT